MLNLAVLLDDSAREVPERSAIIYEGTRLSYAALQAASNQVANGLVQAGIRQGDTVALSCQNLPFFIISLLLSIPSVWAGSCWWTRVGGFHQIRYKLLEPHCND